MVLNAIKLQDLPFSTHNKATYCPQVHHLGHQCLIFLWFHMRTRLLWSGCQGDDHGALQLHHGIHQVCKI